MTTTHPATRPATQQADDLARRLAEVSGRISADQAASGAARHIVAPFLADAADAADADGTAAGARYAGVQAGARAVTAVLDAYDEEHGHLIGTLNLDLPGLGTIARLYVRRQRRQRTRSRH